MHHIGILAHSADGAALCYLEMVRESARRLGEHRHPEITLSILPMGPTTPLWDANDLSRINAHLRHTAERLEAAGCDFFVCPDNTAHIAFDAAIEPYPLPGLHIANVVAEHAKRDGRQRIALLGTRYTMQGPSYPAAFKRHGLDMRTPSAADQELINKVIFEELCQGILTDASRSAYVAIIEKLKSAGCDAVALSCTEIPLLITPEVSPLPTLDSTRLLAHAAVDVALGAEPLPSWRGGAIG
ncbi:MAG: amino acid racemase [Proteobacteria bacterium]|nr:amino acid racemase [Pseudomonadota bacterium]